MNRIHDGYDTGGKLPHTHSKESWDVEPYCTAAGCKHPPHPDCPAPLCTQHARIVFAWVQLQTAGQNPSG